MSRSIENAAYIINRLQERSKLVWFMLFLLFVHKMYPFASAIFPFFRIIFSTMRGTKTATRVGKKTTERPGLTADEIEELREAFNLFDTEATGKIDPRYSCPNSENLNLQCKVLVSNLRTQPSSTWLPIYSLREGKSISKNSWMPLPPGWATKKQG